MDLTGWLALGSGAGGLVLAVLVWWFRRERNNALANLETARQERDRAQADLSEVQRVAVEMDARHGRELGEAQAWANKQTEILEGMARSHPDLSAEYLRSLLRATAAPAAGGPAAPVPAAAPAGPAPGSPGRGP